jgi:hypothetical protein
MSFLPAFLAYWFILFVVSYILVEYGHRYIYDELPKYTPLRVAAGSLLLAIMLTWTRSSFETMFTTDLKWTVLQAILWVAVFILVYTFQPVHGLGFALATMVIATGVATIAVDTMTKPAPDERAQFTAPRAPLRKESTGNILPGKAAAKPATPEAK